MIKEIGRVVSKHDDHVIVEAQRKSVCSKCSARSACGTAVLAKVTGTKRSRIELYNSQSASIGDQVTIGIDESIVVRGSLVVYAVPLIALVLMGLLGEYFADVVQFGTGTVERDVISGVFAVGGLFIAYFNRRRLLNWVARNRQAQPVMLPDSNAELR